MLIADDAGALLGILSERDLLNRVANKRVDLDQATVSQYMTTNPETLVPESFISYALHRMMVGDFRHLPVLEEGSPTAIISSRDILNYIEGHFHETVTRRYDKKMVQEKLKQLAAERAAKEQKDTNG